MVARAELETGGIEVLEGEATVVDVDGTTVGFGGGFAGACASDFGEAEMKAFVGHTKDVSSRLREALEATCGSRCCTTPPPRTPFV